MTAMQLFGEVYSHPAVAVSTRSCISFSTCTPTAVSLAGVPIAYPQSTRSTRKGAVRGSSPFSTTLNDAINALASSRKSAPSVTRFPRETIYSQDAYGNKTKGQLCRTEITKTRNNRIIGARVVLKGEQLG